MRTYWFNFLLETSHIPESVKSCSWGPWESGREKICWGSNLHGGRQLLICRSNTSSDARLYLLKNEVSLKLLQRAAPGMTDRFFVTGSVEGDKHNPLFAQQLYQHLRPLEYILWNGQVLQTHLLNHCFYQGSWKRKKWTNQLIIIAFANIYWSSTLLSEEERAEKMVNAGCQKWDHSSVSGTRTKHLLGIR